MPIECDLDDLKMGGWDPDEVRDLFDFLEFRGGILDRLVEAVGTETFAGGTSASATAMPDAPPLEVEVRRVRDVPEARRRGWPSGARPRPTRGRGSRWPPRGPGWRAARR